MGILDELQPTTQEQQDFLKAIGKIIKNDKKERNINFITKVKHPEAYAMMDFYGLYFKQLNQKDASDLVLAYSEYLKELNTSENGERANMFKEILIAEYNRMVNRERSLKEKAMGEHP